MGAATRSDLRRWFEQGLREGASHMVVVCDTFDHGDFPVYVKKGQDPHTVRDEHAKKPMQRIMEVYNLSMDMEQQLKPGTRVFNFDDGAAPATASTHALPDLAGITNVKGEKVKSKAKAKAKVMPRRTYTSFDKRPESMKLLANIKKNLRELKEMLAKTENEWGAEDRIYRFYHQSFKVFHIQDLTQGILTALRGLNPAGDKAVLDDYFEGIMKAGLGRAFRDSDNRNWAERTRPLLEAYFHAHYFLEMVVKYGSEFRTLKAPPNLLPSGWASVLTLYGIR